MVGAYASKNATLTPEERLLLLISSERLIAAKTVSFLIRIKL